MKNNKLTAAIIIVLVILLFIAVIYIQTLSVLYLIGIFNCSLKTLLIILGINFLIVLITATYITKFLLNRGEKCI